MLNKNYFIKRRYNKNIHYNKKLILNSTQGNLTKNYNKLLLKTLSSGLISCFNFLKYLKSLKLIS